MDFCIGTCAKIDRVGLVPLAEDLGVTHFGVGEGPLLFSDPYQYLALAATQTSTIRLGTMVTNPLTRIAPVTANSMATLNALAPGRTFLGIGTANNALRSMGNRPATIAELTHAIEVTHELMAGRRVVHSWLGQHREVEFLDRAASTTCATRSRSGSPPAGPAASPRPPSTQMPSSTASGRTST